MSALLKSHHASHASSFCIKQCLLLSHHNSHIFVFLFIVDGSCSNFQHIFFNTTKPIFHQSWCSAKWDRDVLLTESVSYVIYIFLAVWPRTFIRVKYSLLMQNWFDNWPKHLAQWPLEPLNSHLVKTFVYLLAWFHCQVSSIYTTYAQHQNETTFNEVGCGVRWCRH